MILYFPAEPAVKQWNEGRKAWIHPEAIRQNDCCLPVSSCKDQEIMQAQAWLD